MGIAGGLVVGVRGVAAATLSPANGRDNPSSLPSGIVPDKALRVSSVKLIPWTLTQGAGW